MKSGKTFLLAAMLLMMAGAGSELLAVDNLISYPAEPMGYENYWNCASRKLGRGISNAAFGALEIPLRIYEVRFEEGGIAGLTYGTLNGVGYFILRELVGVLDVATFLIPLPGCPNDRVNGAGWGFGPILSPEWILTPETDPWNFVYTNTASMS